MKLTFKMTGEEYYSAIKYKLQNDNLKKILSMILCICALVVISIFLKAMTAFYLIIAVLIVLVCSLNSFQKKSIISQYYSSAVRSGEHTICVYDEGIELISSYEKIFAPWQSIYSVKETDENIIFLLSYARGVAAINKKRYSSPELENIMNTVKSNIKVEEVRK